MHSDHFTATQLSMQVLERALDAVKIGVSGEQINTIVGDECKKLGVTPAFMGVGGNVNPFPANLCISVNDVVLHAVPDEKRFEEGDLIKLDFGLIYKGYYTDHCITVGLGKVAEEDERLMRVGKLAVETAVKKAVSGNTTGDLGHAMQTTTELAGFNVLKNFVGHGINRKLHAEPEIPAYGRPGRGAKLKPGMVLCIEAQVVAGNDEIYIADDGWSVLTVDGKKGVMFEFMVEVLKDGNRILTDTRNWPLFK